MRGANHVWGTDTWPRWCECQNNNGFPVTVRSCKRKKGFDISLSRKTETSNWSKTGRLRNKVYCYRRSAHTMTGAFPCTAEAAGQAPACTFNHHPQIQPQQLLSWGSILLSPTHLYMEEARCHCLFLSDIINNICVLPLFVEDDSKCQENLVYLSMTL